MAATVKGSLLRLPETYRYVLLANPKIVPACNCGKQ